MDILSHGLWAGALYKLLNLKRKGKEKFNFFWVVFWGMFPDLFAFTIPFVFLIFMMVTGQMHLSEFPPPSAAEPGQTGVPFFAISNVLYSISHSLIVFALVFAIAFFIFKKKSLVIGGWLLHILMDIPTHTYKFFPTPVFWPLGGWKFNGFPWANPYFLATDYGLLIIVYSWLIWREGKNKKRE